MKKEPKFHSEEEFTDHVTTYQPTSNVIAYANVIRKEI